jgi:hypothetical protein
VDLVVTLKEVNSNPYLDIIVSKAREELWENHSHTFYSPQHGICTMYTSKRQAIRRLLDPTNAPAWELSSKHNYVNTCAERVTN